MLLNSGVGEDPWKSLGLQGDPTSPKGNQSWIFTGRTDAEAETPILWAPDAKNSLIWKDPDAGKEWRQEKGMTEDEMFGWHYWLNGMSLSELWELVIDREAWHACSPRGCKESDTTQQLNWMSIDFCSYSFFSFWTKINIPKINFYLYLKKIMLNTSMCGRKHFLKFLKAANVRH